MASTDAPTDPLLDRGEELSAIGEALAAPQEATGALLLIGGAAGIGKTRLLASTIELGAESGIRFLSARGGELERELPFGVARQLFEPVLAQAGDAERAALLEGAAALAAPAVDPRTDPTARRTPSPRCTACTG